MPDSIVYRDMHDKITYPTIVSMALQSDNGLQSLQQFLRLEPSESRGLDDIVFVAIDLESLSNLKQDSSQNLDSQVSIAILDSRDLISSSPQTVISMYYFVTGSPPSYCSATTIKYLFDKTIKIYQRDILFNLESLVPRTRNIVLLFLSTMGLEMLLKVLLLPHFDLHTSIVGILDIGNIVSKILPNIPVTLSSILSELRRPFQNLHIVGNDVY